MIPTPRYAGARVVVMGLGKSGLSAAASLRASGAEVQVWDDTPAQMQEGAAMMPRHAVMYGPPGIPGCQRCRRRLASRQTHTDVYGDEL